MYDSILSINWIDYYEISPFSIKQNNLVLEFGEEWRADDPEWRNKVRFIIYTTTHYDNLQVYLCKTARNGDPRKTGYYYVAKNQVLEKD